MYTKYDKYVVYKVHYKYIEKRGIKNGRNKFESACQN